MNGSSSRNGSSNPSADDNSSHNVNNSTGQSNTRLPERNFQSSNQHSSAASTTSISRTSQASSSAMNGGSSSSLTTAHYERLPTAWPGYTGSTTPPPSTPSPLTTSSLRTKTSQKGAIRPAGYNENHTHELKTETVTDTHHVHKVWTVKNWSGIPQNEGYILYDQEFAFVGHRWRLRLYPGGVTDNVKGYMSFYLDCRDASDEHPAHERHTFRVVNQLNPSKHWEQHSLPYKEHRDPDGWGWGKFLSHDYLKDEAQGYRVNDTIIFELELYVYGEKKNIVTRKLGRKELPKQLVVEVPDSTLSLDMDRLFNDDKFSDVKFLVGNVKFPAHKCVLSVRSPMLYAMFGTSGMRETREEVVVVEDVDADIFREVLRFIYTDECSLNILENMPIQLLAAADKYQIVRLKCMCENRLFERMTVDDCADVLVAADMHNAAALYKRCLAFMTESAEKVKEVMETDAFKHMTETRPKLMIAIMHAMSEEDIIMTPSKKRLMKLEQEQLRLQSPSNVSYNKRQRLR